MKENKTIQPTLYERLLKKEWSYYAGAVMISILAITLFMFSGSTWGVSGPLTTWGAQFFSLFGVDASVWGTNIDSYKFFGNTASMTDFGLLFGALISCLLAAEWKIRKIKHWKQFAAGALGGLLMGFGARFASGCNIGGLFSQLPRFSVAAWVFLIFVFLGATVGGKLLRFFMPPTSNKRPQRKRLTAEQRKRNRTIQIALGVALIVFFLIVAAVVAPTYPNAPYFIVIGLALGYVMQRSRFCFTAAYRDPTLTGETKLTRAVILAFALCTIMFFGFQASHVDLADSSTYPGNPINLSLVLGSFIFGIGAVLAGGCASGTFVRIGEGYVQNIIALVFFIFGSVFGNAITSRIAGSFMTAGSKVYLPAVLGGNIPALIVQLLVLLGLWIAADKWEQRKRG